MTRALLLGARDARPGERFKVKKEKKKKNICENRSRGKDQEEKRPIRIGVFVAQRATGQIRREDETRTRACPERFRRLSDRAAMNMMNQATCAPDGVRLLMILNVCSCYYPT